MAVVEEAGNGRHETLAWDREHLWHPYTSVTSPTSVREVVGASGVRLQLRDAAGTEHEVVDGMSSWWSAIHGYRVPELDAALSAQAASYSHVMFGGLTHSPAVELGRRLVAITPDPLDKVFLADSGSVAVEVALKMVLQWQRGRTRPERQRFLTVRGGYHGDTFHPMSVTDPDGGMHAMWRGLLPQHVFGPQPPADPASYLTKSSRFGAEDDDFVRYNHEFTRWEAAMRTLAARHSDELAGIVVEPLLQGAGGMHPYPAACLEVLREIADEHALLPVFDEIATGFGRTGVLFASEVVTPDVLCVGKALTGGYLTLSAVLCTSEVAHGVAASESGVLMHGPTFMGNPLACAVASASIDRLLAGDWQADVARIGDGLTDGLAELRSLDGVKDVRTIGAVGVVQLERGVDMVAATDAAIAAGAWLRPFNDLVYAMPPYPCTSDDVAVITGAMGAAVRASLEAS